MGTRHKYDALFQYGQKGNSLVHVSDVENGLKCNCTCPKCNEMLIAHNAGRKKTKHFQHQSLKECNGVYETVLHLLAKEVIQEQGYLLVPDVEFTLPESADNYATSSAISPIEKRTFRKVKFDQIEVERSTESIRPDIVATVNGKQLLIEIAVTHFVDDEKRRRIMAERSPAIEIDLSREDRIIDKSQIRTILSAPGEKVQWIHNPKIDDKRKSQLQVGRAIQEFVGANGRAIKIYGKNRHVYNCPINEKLIDKFEKISIYDACYHCRYFVNEYELFGEMGDTPPRFRPRMLNCIGHVTDEYKKLLKSSGVKLSEGRFWIGG